MHRCLLVMVIALMPRLATADEVVLKGGGRITGQIISRSDASITVNIGAGLVTVSMSSVASVSEGPSILDEYDQRVAKLHSDDVAGWLHLAQWAESRGLGTLARRAHERVVTFDPQNVDANQALGRVLLDGRWVSEQQSYQARGFVQFEGQWMTPAERGANTRQRDAAWQADIARLDAVRRARDAEVALAQAEARAREAEAAARWTATSIPLWWGAWPAVVPGYAPPRGEGRWHGQQDSRSATPGSPWPPQIGTYPSSSMGTYPFPPIGGVWPQVPLSPPPPARTRRRAPAESPSHGSNPPPARHRPRGEAGR